MLVVAGVAVVAASIAAIAVSLSGGSPSGHGRAAAALARQLGCSGIRAPTASPGQATTDAGIHPREEVLCRLDGRTIGITTWASAADQSAAEAMARSVLHSSGQQAYVARGPGWLAGANDENGTTPLDMQKRLAGTIAGRLLGTVQHWP